MSLHAGVPCLICAHGSIAPRIWTDPATFATRASIRPPSAARRGRTNLVRDRALARWPVRGADVSQAFHVLAAVSKVTPDTLRSVPPLSPRGSPSSFRASAR